MTEKIETSKQAADKLVKNIRRNTHNREDLTGNLHAQTGIWPDYAAHIIRHRPGGDWQLSNARWGVPTPETFLKGMGTNSGVTNIRNVASPHWRRWLGIDHRCLVPFTSFSEINQRPGAPRNYPVWFALGPDRPLTFSAGIRNHLRHPY